MTFSNSGIIGCSGQWYSCKFWHHIETKDEHPDDAPFVEIKGFDSDVMFDAYYTESKTKPTKEQFETLMDWCTEMEMRFENVTDCWDEPWENYRDGI